MFKRNPDASDTCLVEFHALESLVQSHEKAIERIEETLQEIQEQLYNLRN